MIKKVDHVVITTEDIEKCLEFYEQLGFTVKDGGGRYELFAGDFKINVHILGHELLPHAHKVQPGSGDLCFEVSGCIENYKEMLEQKGVEVEFGVVTRTGVQGTMKSIYIRDFDGNLLEFCSYN